MRKKKVIIIGAAGRDFHNFNTLYRDDSRYEVVAFTAAQIPDIEGRSYPAELAGPLYPAGIPIYSQDDLSGLIRRFGVDECVFAYSDVSNQYVMELAAMVQVAGDSTAELFTAFAAPPPHGEKAACHQTYSRQEVQ